MTGCLCTALFGANADASVLAALVASAVAQFAALSIYFALTGRQWALRVTADKGLKRLSDWPERYHLCACTAASLVTGGVIAGAALAVARRVAGIGAGHRAGVPATLSHLEWTYIGLFVAGLVVALNVTHALFAQRSVPLVLITATRDVCQCVAGALALGAAAAAGIGAV